MGTQNVCLPARSLETAGKLFRKDIDDMESLFLHLLGFFGFPNQFRGETADSFSPTPITNNNTKKSKDEIDHHPHPSSSKR
jgi:hypothetical protein